MYPRLKNIIKKKLSEDLSSVSIIDYNGSIWFINAKSKYWYLEFYKKTKTLWWRLDFFEDFFLLFGMEQREFVPIIAEWVEEVLNGKVASTRSEDRSSITWVEEALKGEVVSVNQSNFQFTRQVEEALHDGVVSSTEPVSTRRQKLRQETQVGEILNAEGVSADSQIFIQEAFVQELFKNMIGKASPDCNSDYLRVEDVISYHNSLMPE